jgi:hypothetical protein
MTKKKKLPGILPAQNFTEVTSTPTTGATIYRYNCLNCGTTESMIGSRQMLTGIKKKANSHRCNVPPELRKDIYG